MALGLTQPLVKMRTRNIPGDKGGRCVRLTTSPPSHAECHGIWEPKPPGTLWATPGLLWELFTLPSICNENSTVYNTSLYGDLKVCGKGVLCVSLNISTLVYRPV
jgi:hypothetical protein